MSIRKILFILALILCNACSSDIFLDHNGNIPSSEKIAHIHNGQTKEDVIAILGSPSTTTGLNNNHWIYISTTIERIAFLKPKELDRQILALTFEDNKVNKIEKFTLADANNITIDTDETKSTDREQGFFRKYFGGVGAYMPFGGTRENGL